MKKEVILAVVAVLPAVACATAQTLTKHQTDPITEATGYTGEDLKSFKQMLKDVRAFDQESAASNDISVSKARATPTSDLVTDFLRSSEWVVMLQYDHPSVGIYRLSLASPSLAELMRRKDFGEGMIKAYASFEVDPRRNPHYKQDGGPMALSVMETLMAYKPLFAKLRGHEKELLTAMCNRYWAVKRVNATYPEKERPYRANSFPLELAYALQRQMGVKLPPDVSIDSATKEIRFKGKLPTDFDALVVKFAAMAS